MGAAGINVPLKLKQVIRHWWNAQFCPTLKPLYQAVPSIITWELWKKRNVGKHGGSVSKDRVIREVNRTLHQLARVRYAWLSNIPLLWPDIIQFFEGYKLILITRRVTWQLPHYGWYKCNTDGASKENPGPSSLGFCVRNDEGNLVYAREVDLGVTTNVVIEGGWDPPWAIVPDVQKIKDMRDNFNVIFQHVFREGTTEFHSFSELPSAGRRLINLDKSQTPNLRVRIAKRRASD
ncbi:uncharacterized protein LOC142167230 [Nicotiana tabacum]|uniref:Uncharacterized protein LOC142167230 n=1 Tax=Nicotiana tabacum TaxID=4097 RepID=A0AC58SET4_TOBAC